MKRILLLLALSVLPQFGLMTNSSRAKDIKSSAPAACYANCYELDVPISSEDGVPSMTESQQGVKNAAVPTVHNQRLDNLYRKFASNSEEMKLVNSYLNEVYENCGTFLASARIQHEIDKQVAYALLDENVDALSRVNPKLGEKVIKSGSAFSKAVRPKANEVNKWLEGEYTSKVLKFLSFDHKPTAEEVLNKLDTVSRRVGLWRSDEQIYEGSMERFKKNKIKNRTDNQSMSEFIAYAMCEIEMLLFQNTFEDKKITEYRGEEWVSDRCSGVFIAGTKIDYWYDIMHSIDPDKIVNWK